MKFTVPSMSCGHCKASIEKAIASLDRAAEVIVDLEGKTVQVTSSRNESQIVEAMKTAGFEAKAA